MGPIWKAFPLKLIGGGEEPSVDVTGSNLDNIFDFENVPDRIDNLYVYVQHLEVIVETQIDQPASGGAAIDPDDLPRAVTSFDLSSEDLGTPYEPNDINGPRLGLIAGIVGGGYKASYPWPAQVASTDGDTAVDIRYHFPVAQKFMKSAHQTGLWSGLLQVNGRFNVRLSPSTWPAAVSTGAASEATTNVRVIAHCTLEPEIRLAPLWRWKLHKTPANQDKHALAEICKGKGMNGVVAAGKLAFLAYVADVNGLGGADGLDNITRVYSRALGIDNLRYSDTYDGYSVMLNEFVRGTMHRVITPGDKQSDSAYPLPVGATTDNSPNVAGAYFGPLEWPDPEMPAEVSKMREVFGTIDVNHDYTSKPSSEGLWLSCECSYWSDEFLKFVAEQRLKVPGGMGAWRWVPKVKGLRATSNPGEAAQQLQKLRGMPLKLVRR